MGAAKVEETPTAQAASRICRRRAGKRKICFVYVMFVWGHCMHMMGWGCACGINQGTDGPTSWNQGNFMRSHAMMQAMWMFGLVCPSRHTYGVKEIYVDAYAGQHICRIHQPHRRWPSFHPMHLSPSHLPFASNG